MEKLNLNYLTEMSNEELFEEISDAEYFNVRQESQNQLYIIIAGKKELVKRGFKTRDNVEVQFIPFNAQILNQL